MNANVLHRWLKEHACDGRHQLKRREPSGATLETSHVPAFIPVKLPAVLNEPLATEFKVELCKGALSTTVCWPVSAADAFVQWTKSLFK